MACFEHAIDTILECFNYIHIIITRRQRRTPEPDRA